MQTNEVGTERLGNARGPIAPAACRLRAAEHYGQRAGTAGNQPGEQQHGSTLLQKKDDMGVAVPNREEPGLGGNSWGVDETP